MYLTARFLDSALLSIPKLFGEATVSYLSSFHPHPLLLTVDCPLVDEKAHIVRFSLRPMRPIDAVDRDVLLCYI